jgi:hypothetical protein
MSSDEPGSAFGAGGGAGGGADGGAGPRTNVQSEACEFCGKRAEISVTAFDPLVPLGPPRPVCRFCLGRPHRQRALGEDAHTLRLQDLSTGRTATGRSAELGALLHTLSQQRGERTITAAIRVQSYAAAPIALVCAGCGGTVTPARGGLVVWRQGADGRRTDARLLHGHGCAAQAGQPLRPGCWEELAQLGTLDLMRFDEESMGYLTDVELACKQLSET